MSQRHAIQFEAKQTENKIRNTRYYSPLVQRGTLTYHDCQADSQGKKWLRVADVFPELSVGSGQDGDDQ